MVVGGSAGCFGAIVVRVPRSVGNDRSVDSAITAAWTWAAVGSASNVVVVMCHKDVSAAGIDGGYMVRRY